MNATTYKGRIDQYEWRKGLTTWVGAGYVTLIALMNSKLIERAPEQFSVWAFVLIIVGGGSLGFARVGFEWKAIELRRKLGTNDLGEGSHLLPEDKPWPEDIELRWKMA